MVLFLFGISLTINIVLIVGLFIVIKIYFLKKKIKKDLESSEDYVIDEKFARDFFGKI